MKLITRDGGKELASVVALTDKAQTAELEKKRAEAEFEEKTQEIEKRYRDQMTVGVQNLAIATVFGFGLGGGLAYLAHDYVADYFGRGSPMALLTLPAAGIVVIAATPKMLQDSKKAPGEKKEERAASYGAGLGLLVVGGYCSYEDYMAPPANP